MELQINPDYPDSEAFSAIATEIALTRFHNKGRNKNYSCDNCELDAESIFYILYRRFGVKCELPDTSRVDSLYAGWEAQERRAALDCIQDMSKQIGGSIERAITPQQRTRIPI